jgi:hypothetical protein
MGFYESSQKSVAGKAAWGIERKLMSDVNK